MTKTIQASYPQTIKDCTPDQLIFEYLYNLRPKDDFWVNDLRFTRDIFTNEAREIINLLEINGERIDLCERITAYKDKGQKQESKLRDFFKSFYNSEKIQPLFSASMKPANAWSHWVKMNPDPTNVFLEAFKEVLYGIMKNGYAVDDLKLTALKVKLKKGSHVL